MVVQGYGQEAQRQSQPNWTAWILLAFAGWLVGSIMREDVRARK